MSLDDFYGGISLKDQERPLPPLPNDARPSGKQPSLAQKTASIPIVFSKAVGKRRAAALDPRHTLTKVLKHPAVLARLLSALPWHSCHSLLGTCREFRELLARTELRDIILSEYVPGYRACLGHSSTDGLQLLDIDMSDLALLSESCNTAYAFVFLMRRDDFRAVPNCSASSLSFACSQNPQLLVI